MEGSDGSPPQSLCMIQAAELFPKPQMEKEDSQLTVPFQELAGESVKYLGRTDDGVLALSTYRIFMFKNSTNSETSVPLFLIESAQARDLFHLIINCKDASTVKCSFETAEQCSEWQRRIQLAVCVPDTLEALFAFPFYRWTCDSVSAQNGGSTGSRNGDNVDGICSMPDYCERLQRASRYEDDFLFEMERLGFDLNGAWRISHANADFKLCPSYPQKLLVPCCISDEMLHAVANFRGSRRLPAVVWRHRKSGAVIARCSQPEVGWLGWRNAKDEQLLKALADACAFDRGELMRRLMQGTAEQTLPSGESSPSSPDGSHVEVALDELRKVLIVDARSYTSAVTNRARGGGCECIEYYPCAEIEFMNLGNIHAIRRSFHALRQLCASPPDIPNWLGLLEKTMWLQHLSGLLAASMTVCHAVEKKGRPVLVHCSDGWDRTPQIVATAQLCLDPFYRTVEGFRILVEREWLNFGHKFSDRCGHGPGSDELNERCPVFLQWLDLVHQIHKQFPCSFEFSMAYLIKLAQHSHSCLFGTFLCNTYKERLENTVFERTFSVWPFLSGPMYRNPLYVPNRDKVIWPAHNVRDLYLWSDVYLGSLGNQNSVDFPASNTDGLHGSTSPMAKTRSYGDLITAGIIQNGISRRSSDPNMIVDPNLTMGSNSENNSIADIQSEREDSPDIIANLIHDTTRNIQNLTIELNNHDEENFIRLQHEHQQQQPQPQSQQQKREAQLSEGNEGNSETESYEETMQKALQYQLQQQHYQEHEYEPKQIDTATYAVNGGSEPSVLLTAETGCSFFSSPTVRKTSGDSSAEMKNTNHSTPASLSVVGSLLREAATTSGYKSCRNSANDKSSNDTVAEDSRPHHNGDCVDGVVEDGGGGVFGARSASVSGSITIHKAGDMSLDLMQSVDLGDPTSKADSLGLESLENQQQDWHGSVSTSTDTLVPIESRQQHINANGDVANDVSDGVYASATVKVSDAFSASTLDFLKEERKSSSGNAGISTSTNYSILPKVHTVTSRPNVLSTSSSNASVSSTSSSLNNLHNIGSNYNYNNTNSNNSLTNQSANNKSGTDSEALSPAPPIEKGAFSNTTVDPMEESILILPEHQKLEISFSGKCETISSTANTVAPAITATAAGPTQSAYGNANNSVNMPSYSYSPYAIAATYTSQRRRRTSSSNSRRDGLAAKQANGSTITRFSLPGVRSLPMTPPGLPERPQINISCPDGLAHALSEQNIRLQQIVHEHKLREDVLLREIHDMRMALLKKSCPNCNNVPAANEEQCSALDNIENASICSWEAVEDRSGPSSCTSSSVQQNATSVLWVPDHAVSRCTSCQTEFWLGRRKHHCRSCGQIFCADCSEFWAPLPDERLFSPVRLCGPCYHSVTTRMQQQSQRSYNTTGCNNSTNGCSNNTHIAAAASTAAAVSAGGGGNGTTLDAQQTTATVAATVSTGHPAANHTNANTSNMLQQQQQQQQQQQHQRQIAAAAAAATAATTSATANAAVAAVAATATAAAAAANTQIESSNMSQHMLLANNIAASVAN